VDAPRVVLCIIAFSCATEEGGMKMRSAQTSVYAVLAVFISSVLAFQAVSADQPAAHYVLTDTASGTYVCPE
jgi:TctA family transporter